MGGRRREGQKFKTAFGWIVDLRAQTQYTVSCLTSAHEQPLETISIVIILNLWAEEMAQEIRYLQSQSKDMRLSLRV